MAFDLLSRKTTKQSWARGQTSGDVTHGEMSGSVSLDLAVARAKNLPWNKILLGTGVAAGLGLVALAVTNPNHKARRELRRRDDPRLQHDDWSQKTQELPPETMRQLLELRKRA